MKVLTARASTTSKMTGAARASWSRSAARSRRSPSAARSAATSCTPIELVKDHRTKEQATTRTGARWRPRPVHQVVSDEARQRNAAGGAAATKTPEAADARQRRRRAGRRRHSVQPHHRSESVSASSRTTGLSTDAPLMRGQPASGILNLLQNTPLAKGTLSACMLNPVCRAAIAAEDPRGRCARRDGRQGGWHFWSTIWCRHRSVTSFRRPQSA